MLLLGDWVSLELVGQPGGLQQSQTKCGEASSQMKPRAAGLSAAVPDGVGKAGDWQPEVQVVDVVP